MFGSERQRRRDAQEDDWGDLGAFAATVEASLHLVDPDPSFRWALRQRLMQAAAAQIARREAAVAHRSAVARGMLMGAGAAAAAAAAGAILVYWRRNHPEAFGPMLHAKGA